MRYPSRIEIMTTDKALYDELYARAEKNLRIKLFKREWWFQSGEWGRSIIGESGKIQLSEIVDIGSETQE
jgi:hypothetical protein